MVKAVLTDEKIGLYFLLLFVVLLPAVLYIHACSRTAAITPGKDLEKTLTRMANEALRQHRRTEEVVSVSGFSCIRKSRYADNSCTADAHFADGTTAQICILRMFDSRFAQRGRNFSKVTMTVSMCDSDSDIDITESFGYSVWFYDADDDLKR